MLKIRNLEKTFGKYHALSGLNLEIPHGALFGLSDKTEREKRQPLRLSAVF